jgi:hypothetical protein
MLSLPLKRICSRVIDKKTFCIETVHIIETLYIENEAIYKETAYIDTACIETTYVETETLYIETASLKLHT